MINRMRGRKCVEVRQQLFEGTVNSTLICRISENCTYSSNFKSDMPMRIDGLIPSTPFRLFLFCLVPFCHDQSALSNFPALCLLLFVGVKCAVVEKNKTFSSHPQAHFINNRTMEVNFLCIGETLFVFVGILNNQNSSIHKTISGVPQNEWLGGGNSKISTAC